VRVPVEGLGATSTRRLAASVMGWQATVWAVGAVAVGLSPLGLGAAVPIGAAGWMVGAWAGAVRQPQELPRSVVKATVVRVGAGWGSLLGASYASLALIPGFLEVQGPAVLLVAGILGGIAGITAAGLSLCGMDATGKVT